MNSRQDLPATSATAASAKSNCCPQPYSRDIATTNPGWDQYSKFDREWKQAGKTALAPGGFGSAGAEAPAWLQPHELLNYYWLLLQPLGSSGGTRGAEKGWNTKAGNTKEPETAFPGIGRLMGQEVLVNCVHVFIPHQPCKPSGVQQNSGPPAHPFQALL